MSDREFLARRLVAAFNLSGPDFDHVSEMHRAAAFRMADEVETFYAERLGAALDPAARAEGRQVGMERPPGAGWSEVPTQEAAHPERLSAEELRLTGAALSEWAWDHLAKGYGTNLTVREVSRLIQAVKATVETAAPSSDRAEGVAALRQAGEPAGIGQEDIERLLRDHLSLTCGRHCEREMGQADEDECYRDAAGAILAKMGSPLPQQTALVEQGVEE